MTKYNGLISLLVFLLCSGTLAAGIECHPGAFCDPQKSSNPQDCPVGTFSLVGQMVCTPCRRGYYQALTGKSFCEECPEGKWLFQSQGFQLYSPHNKCNFEKYLKKSFEYLLEYEVIKILELNVEY